MTFDEIFSRNDLAELINIRHKDLTYVLYIKGPDSYYTTFSIPKKDGSDRIINAPHGELLYIQRSLAEAIYNYNVKIEKEHNITSKISFAFKKNKSFILNAEVHRNKQYVINLDLKDFFPTINFGRVLGFFINNAYWKLSKETATIIAQLSCYKVYSHKVLQRLLSFQTSYAISWICVFFV